MTAFLARSLPPQDRAESSRDGATPATPPQAAPADPFFSAMIDLLNIDQLHNRQTMALQSAHKACAGRNTDSLRLHLALIRVNADQIKQATLAMDAKVAPDIDDATQVYGE